MNLDPLIVQMIALTLGPGGAVYFGFKFGLNGFKDEVRGGMESMRTEMGDVKSYTRETRDEVRGLRADMGEVRERVSGLEAVTDEI